MSFVMAMCTMRSTILPYTTLFRSYVLNDAEIAYAIVEDQEQVDKILEAAPQVPSLKHIYYDDPRGLRNYEGVTRSEEHTSELQSLTKLVCGLLLEKKKAKRLL